MANFLEMKYTSDVERAGFSIESEPPDSGTIDHTLVWARVRLSLSSEFTAPETFFIPTPSGSLAYAELVRIYMQSADAVSSVQAVVGFEVSPTTNAFIRIDAYANSPSNAALYMMPTSSYYGNNNNLQRQRYGTVNRLQLMNNRPMDVVVLVGKDGATHGGRAWVGPAGGPYQQIVSGTVINSNFSGSLPFTEINIFPNEGLYVGRQQTLRLFQWEVVDGITNPDPFNILSATPSFTGSLSGVQFMGDDFSTYTSKSEFQIAVNNSTSSNAADEFPAVFYNQNYLGYNGADGFYDNGFAYASGSSFGLVSTLGRYMNWRYVSSSTNAAGVDFPFGGTAIWQLVNANGTPFRPDKLNAFISGNWAVSGVIGHPALGMFEYTSSVSQSSWRSPASGGVIREWIAYPGTPVETNEISMSLRSLVNATFNVPIPSRSYGASMEYSNYGFYPTSPINYSASILDIP